MSSLRCFSLFAEKMREMENIQIIFRSWRTLQFVFVLPNFLLLAYKFILPESPRWLATKGKVYSDNQKTLE